MFQEYLVVLWCHVVVRDLSSETFQFALSWALLEDDRQEPLVAPCRCRGSMRGVHALLDSSFKKCLHIWQSFILNALQGIIAFHIIPCALQQHDSLQE